MLEEAQQYPDFKIDSKPIADITNPRNPYHFFKMKLDAGLKKAGKGREVQGMWKAFKENKENKGKLQELNRQAE